MTRFRSPRQRPGPDFPEALERLRSGAVLRLEYQNGRPSWSIGDGPPVPPEVVALLLGCKEIEAAGDGLFDGAPSQTWRLK